MIHLRWSCIYVVIILFADFSMASTEANVDKKVMKRFEVNWESLRYNKSVTQYNPKVSSNRQAPRADESLTLSCEITIKDPNLVLGTLREGIITEITDSKGRNVEINQEQPQVSHTPYEGLRYQHRFTQPPVIPRWRALLRRFLRIQPTPFKPVLVDELQPARVQFQVDLGLLGPPGGEIRNLKGYFYALMAESVEYVDVPFEPNDQWVQLTDKVETQVRQANCTISGTRLQYNYEIEENQIGAEGIRPLSIGDYLPEKIVMGRQFIGEDGKQLNRPMGFGFVPTHVGGSGSGSSSSSGGPIKKIRFVIAVKPKHYKIPFELKNIPLPNPESKEEKE
jgi:hypothetical protein